MIIDKSIPRQSDSLIHSHYSFVSISTVHEIEQFEQLKINAYKLRNKLKKYCLLIIFIRSSVFYVNSRVYHTIIW